MKRFGVVGRADHGGIAQQSLAVARHLQPAAALVLDMSPGDRGRGPFDPTPWHKTVDNALVATFPFSDEALDWLLAESDVIYTVESPPPGRDDFPQRCAEAGVELIIHCNPELYRPSYRGATTRLVLPTTWHQERHPDATILPMPVDRARFPFRLRTKAKTFLHVSAPAFHDRAGTTLLQQCLPFVRSPITLLIRGVNTAPPVQQVGNVRVEFLPPVADNAELYPDEADVLVVPRRYGGLSLVAAESASLGLPLVTLDLPPLNDRPGVVTVPVQAPYEVAMIGGEETVWGCAAEHLAGVIDTLAGDPGGVEVLSRGADRWAADHAWPKQLGVWKHTLGIG